MPNFESDSESGTDDDGKDIEDSSEQGSNDDEDDISLSFSHLGVSGGARKKSASKSKKKKGTCDRITVNWEMSDIVLSHHCPRVSICDNSRRYAPASTGILQMNDATKLGGAKTHAKMTF